MSTPETSRDTWATSGATLHLLHGLPGAGKTTYARQLEVTRRAVRFTPDEWMIALHGTNPPEAVFRPQHGRILELIWEHAARVLATGTDAIIDDGFWSRAKRAAARARAETLGVACQWHDVRCDVDTARARVLQRTAALPPGSLVITDATFDWILNQFEPLGSDEPCVVVATT